MRRACRSAFALLALGACATRPAVRVADDRAGVPAPEREFRAVWVATVGNIDWPSAPGLPAPRQRAEAEAILDRCVALGLNAVVLQVRPQCDAFYASALEPWSYFLTGEQGRPPTPYYDPLAFWVEAAHARGLELHAWFNPYRANHPEHDGPLSPQSIARRRPDLIRTLGASGYLWLDPARAEAREHTLAVILDVVARYEIDGVHLDDYFYPYPSYSGGADFPDDASWKAYLATGGRLSRGDWRRHNVDLFVQALHDRLGQVPRRVKFGISPFGIWRPGHPPSIVGLDQHEALYADARRWLREGWVDYYSPQLYWPISQVPQSFPVLLGWWTRNNPMGRHLWPGLYTSRVGARGWSAAEIVDQLMVERGFVPEGPGHIHFSARALLDTTLVGSDGDTLTTTLTRGPYRRPALVPPTPWLDAVPPAAPEAAVDVREGAAWVAWRRPAGENPFVYVVYSERERAGWSYRVVPAARTGLRLALGGGSGDGRLRQVAVTAVDRMGNESPVRAHRVAGTAAGS